MGARVAPLTHTSAAAAATAAVCAFLNVRARVSHVYIKPIQRTFCFFFFFFFFFLLIVGTTTGAEAPAPPPLFSTPIVLFI
jgi:hypothetical protein